MMVVRVDGEEQREEHSSHSGREDRRGSTWGDM